jgi:hypothetical protein
MRLSLLLLSTTCKTMQQAPLSLAEIETLGELLASIPEPYIPMEPDMLDGYLTAITLMRNPPEAEAWFAPVLSLDGNPPRAKEFPTITKLRHLVFCRGAELEAAILAEKPIDPILFDEDATEEDPFSPLRPFANGFLQATLLWPELMKTENDAVRAALVGILRYADIDADDKESQSLLKGIEEDIAFATLDEALSDLQACVAEIAEVTRLSPKKRSH